MSYVVHIYGRLAIEPPVPFYALHAVQEAADKTEDLALHTEVNRRLTPEGELDVITGIGIECKGEENRARNMAMQLAGILKALPEGTRVTGELRMEGEGAGDVRRLYAQGPEAVEDRAILTWPDGTPVE